MRKSGKPDFRCHPRLACCHVLKAWMPGIKPGMTDEGTVLHVMAGFIPATRVLLVAMS